MGISEIIQEKKEQILALSAKYGASNVRIFGSVANGTANENSDIDFLVDLEKDRSLFDLGSLLMELQELLNRKVFVTTENGLHWYVKESVLSEVKTI